LVPVINEHARRHYVEPLYATGGPGYQAQNYSVAQAAAQRFLDRDPAEPLAHLRNQIPGRAEVIDGDPTEIFDAAHNPDGARALVETLPTLVGDREVICCLAVLEGKDARGIVEALAPACSQFVCTQIPEAEMRGTGRPDARSVPASQLGELCTAAGATAEAVDDPIAAWARARELARERGAVALAAGSHYLLSCIWTERRAPSS
jgi:dihydrofolate synthase/folylpolyglutamate synthase